MGAPRTLQSIIDLNSDIRDIQRHKLEDLHDPIPKFLVNYRFDWVTVYDYTL
jgi:hypothetical protein